MAFVFYIYRESQGQLEMTLGGFSGRATRLLARMLATRAEDFWPPVYKSPGVQVGAFIVQFSISTQQDTDADDLLKTDLQATRKVIPMAEEAIERRLQKSAK